MTRFAAIVAMLADAHAAGHAEGARAELRRVTAILRAPEAEGRTATAIALALDTDVAPADAVKVLRLCPRDDAGPSVSPRHEAPGADKEAPVVFH